MKKKILKILAIFPSKLPVGAKDFEGFCNAVIWLYDLPNLSSYKHTIATMILQLPPTTFYKSKRYFGLCVKKAMSNQVAFEMIQKINDDEDKAQTNTASEAYPQKDSLLDEPIPVQAVQSTPT